MLKCALDEEQKRLSVLQKMLSALQSRNVEALNEFYNYPVKGNVTKTQYLLSDRAACDSDLVDVQIRIRKQSELISKLEEYLHCKELYEKLNEIKNANPVECFCCGKQELKNVAISDDDGAVLVGETCMRHALEIRCNTYRDNKLAEPAPWHVKMETIENV